MGDANVALGFRYSAAGSFRTLAVGSAEPKNVVIGQSTFPGDEDYTVFGMNGTLDDSVAVGFQFDRTGTDPTFYFTCNGAMQFAAVPWGLVVPRLTTAQRDALAGAQRILFALIGNVTTQKLNFWDGAAWRVVTSV